MKFILSLILLSLTYYSYSQTVNITGRCFYDVNRNNIFDGTDSVIANRVITASYNSSSFTANTNAAGQYSLAVVAVTNIEYYFEMSGLIDYSNYNGIYNIMRTYTVAGNDIVNFAFQRKDSIQEVNATIWSQDFSEIPPSGGTKTYKLSYGYDGLLPTIPGTLTLRFNPKLTLQSTSIATSTSSSGLLQWNFPSIIRNTNFFTNQDSIILTFNFPAIGDTIGEFILSPKLVPGINIVKPYSRYFNSTRQSIDHPYPLAIGTSNGVKWLRHYAPTLASQNQYGQSIDTTQNGSGYFVTGQQNGVFNNGTSSNNIYVSKLNKDGLSIWEKNIRYLPNNLLFTDVTAIKHTNDGGCLLLGSAIDTSIMYNYNRRKVIVLRINATGDIVWKKILTGSKYSEPGRSILVLADGSIMITGTTESNDGDFINNNIDTLNGNIFVTKLSSNGNMIFTKVYGGSSYEYGDQLVPLQNGSFLLTGTTGSNDGDVTGNPHIHYTINPNPNYYYGNNYYNDTLYSEEAWVLNINSSGNIIWNKCYGGRSTSIINGAAENNGGLMLTGFTNSKDGDLPYYPEMQVSLWVQQVSASNGSIIWNKLYKLYKGYQDSNYVSPPFDIFENQPLKGLHKTKDGNFITGFLASDKYGDIKTKHGYKDFSFVKINSLGNIVWQKSVGGTDADHLNDLVLDRNDDIIFTGYSTSNNDDLYVNIENTLGFQPSLMVVGKLGITNTIKGQVFIDNNNNHIKDPGEIFYSQGQILSVKNTDSIRARIFNGKYLSNVDTGSYVSTYKPANNYFSVYPTSHNTNFTTFDLQDSVDFALTALPNISDLEIQIIPLSIPRPGFNVTYRVITKNASPLPTSNAVIGFKHDNRQIYTSASRLKTGMTADSIWWGPFTLNGFAIDTLDVNFTLKAPPFLVNGDTITNTVTINPLVGDNMVSNNISKLRERVLGSFDPNDKTESHAGTLTTTQYAGGEYLQYLIRFQNTGTDTAFFITVKDTLQSKLDLNTLDILATSHPFTFNLEGQVATWDFKKILLPDSTTNEPASHGFILFKVKPKTGLNVGDEFNNKAAIYFDYNLPVITNEDKTILGSNTGVCPNGAVSFNSGLTGTTYQWQVNNGSGYTNLVNGGIYSDVNSSVIRLSNVPTSFRGYKYRCLVNGNTYSPEYKLRFAVEWRGNISTAWENPSNWDCGIVPDAKTDVVIPTSTNYPIVNSNRSCYSLQLATGSSVMVKTNFNLSITGQVGL